ncbi:MAG: RDD family protein [bacterium]
MEQVTVVLADEDVERRIELKKMLFQNPDMDVVGETEDHAETLEVVTDENPEILLLSFPLEADKETADLVEELAVEAPQTEIILIAESMEESEVGRSLQRLGARDSLVRPLESDELLDVIEDVISISRRQKEKLTEMMGGTTVSEQKERPGKLISVFSTKGGVGRSLISTNLACMIRELTGKSVALVDLDLQFGDAAIMLDMTPTTMIASLARDCKEEDRVDYDLLERYMHEHEDSGIELLAAPPRPEEADYVQAAETRKILDALKRHYHYVVVDTSSQITEPVIASLENSDLIVLLLTLELPTIKDGKLMLELIDDLGLSRDKVQVIMNRDIPNSEIELQEVEEALDQDVLGGLPSDGRVVMPSVNEGRPVVLSHPNAEFTQKFRDQTRRIVGEFLELEDELKEEEEQTSGVGDINLPLAPIGSRLMAGLIDFSLAYLVGWGLFIFLGIFTASLIEANTAALFGVLVGSVGFLVPLAYHALLDVGPQTLGNQLMELEVVDRNGDLLSFGNAALRALIGVFGVLFLFLGPLMALLTQNQQGLHDLLVDSYVVTTSSAETGGEN